VGEGPTCPVSTFCEKSLSEGETCCSHNKDHEGKRHACRQEWDGACSWEGGGLTGILC
jgi:hypothetical protein